MIFRVAAKKEIEKLFTVLAKSNRVVGPVEKARDRNGKPIYFFEEISDFGDLRLEYTTTKAPPKRYFLPFKEDLATFRVENGDWTKTVSYDVERPTILFGLHACDINALNKLDKVLMGSVYPMPYYAAKRKNLFIVGYDCTPQPLCFCRSMGADTALHGFDMFITDIGEKLFIEILSEAAYDFIRNIESAEPEEDDHVKYMKTVADKNKKFTASVDTTDLMKILDMEFQSERWRQWGDKCFSCGACSKVCPTCYCYGVEETADIDLKGARKTKFLYSCNIVDFAEVSGGHNFRPERHIRLKYRYYHKHRGFVEAFEESLCVGCGRCGEACLAGITVPEVIASIRGEGGVNGQ
jgi:sulfhydrogenase subunit beta (sulfur reductase)